MNNRSESSDDKLTTELSHKWNPKTTLVVGDSTIAGIDETRISGSRNVKVRTFPGATIADMYDYLKLLLKKCPDAIILHIGTNNAVNETSRSILDSILSLKNFIQKSLPSSKVIISNLIQRTCNGIASLAIAKLNEHLSNLELDIIDKSNISNDCLVRKGLHLNERGYGKLAINFIKEICK